MKKELRARLLKQRDALSAEFIRQTSQTLQEMLLGLPVFQKAERLMIYVSMDSEVCTDELIHQALHMGKRVMIPYLHKRYGQMDASEIRNLEQEVMVGKFNTRVPKPEYFRPFAPQDLQLIVVPAIAFDLRGNRLGYGGGYYDRYLKRIVPETVRIGINFSCQVVDELPVYQYDMPVDIVLHEKGIIHTTKKVRGHP